MRLPPLEPAVLPRPAQPLHRHSKKDGRLLTVHVPSSDRLRELLFTGNEVWIEGKAKKGYVTAGALYLARSGSELVCIHTFARACQAAADAGVTLMALRRRAG
ncbi:MAG: DNA/RNA nuclease SfsA [Firmicutes bacterium]|nr:DNA/RNA nuclease SfsA [Bacillota bacterium]